MRNGHLQYTNDTWEAKTYLFENVWDRSIFFLTEIYAAMPPEFETFFLQNREISLNFCPMVNGNPK